MPSQNQLNSSYDTSKTTEKWRRKATGANADLKRDRDASQLPNTTEASVCHLSSWTEVFLRLYICKIVPY